MLELLVLAYPQKDTPTQDEPTRKRLLRDKLTELVGADLIEDCLEWIEKLPRPDPQNPKDLIAYGADPQQDIKIKKIVASLTRIAEANGAELNNFRWWSIDQRERHLLAIVQLQNGLTFQMIFVWKRTQHAASDRMPTNIGQRNIAWSRDQVGLARCGWRIDIHSATYEGLKRDLEQFFRDPLPPLPGHLANYVLTNDGPVQKGNDPEQPPVAP